MSRITKDDALDIVKGLYAACDDRYVDIMYNEKDKLINYINQQTQLSEDVGEAQKIFDEQQDTLIQLLGTIERQKEHIQAQANTIDRTQYQLEIAWEQISEQSNEIESTNETWQEDYNRLKDNLNTKIDEFREKNWQLTQENKLLQQEIERLEQIIEQKES